MTPQEYIQLAQRTKGPLQVIVVPGNEDILHAAIGMCTETGEIQDAIKKHLFYGQKLDYTNIKEELGDTLWYISLALHYFGWSFEEVMEENIEKLRVRYPEKFTPEAAKERKDKTGAFIGIDLAKEKSYSVCTVCGFRIDEDGHCECQNTKHF